MARTKLYSLVSTVISFRKRERDRQTDRQTDRETETERDRDRDRERQRENRERERTIKVYHYIGAESICGVLLLLFLLFV